MLTFGYCAKLVREDSEQSAVNAGAFQITATQHWALLEKPFG